MLLAGVVLFLFPLIFNISLGLIEWTTGKSIREFLPWSKPYPPDWPYSHGLSYDEVQRTLLETPKEDEARKWSEYYTSGPHLAGKNLSQALWTRSLWQEFGVKDTSIASYDVFLNYPRGHQLTLYEKSSNGSSANPKQSATSWHVKFNASLEEDVLEEDSTTGLKDRIPTFHGYSASGNATASYVYVNYGTYEDYGDLLNHGIDLRGKIAIAKYGKIFRGLKVRRAAELGMLGVVIYSDPGDDGDVTEVHGEKAYPKGKARNPSSVQRGSAEALSKC